MAYIQCKNRNLEAKITKNKILPIYRSEGSAMLFDIVQYLPVYSVKECISLMCRKKSAEVYCESRWTWTVAQWNRKVQDRCRLWCWIWWWWEEAEELGASLSLLGQRCGVARPRLVLTDVSSQEPLALPTAAQWMIGWPWAGDSFPHVKEEIVVFAPLIQLGAAG